MESGKLLVIGSTGFIGRRLVRTLLAQGLAVRGLSRRPDGAPPPGLEPVCGDLLQPESLDAPLAGIDTVYFLAHSLAAGEEEFARRDRQAAHHFVAAAQRQGVRRVIYLSGLGEPGPELSAHLASRREVAEILRGGAFRTTVLRAAIIIGAGGASYELIRFLVRTQVLLPAPPWLDTRCQPIAVADVIRYLDRCRRVEATAGETFDIGGPEVLTYRQMLERFARVAGEVNLFWPVPFLLPRVAALMAGTLGPVSAPVTEALLRGLRNEVVCREGRLRDLIPFPLTPFEEAVRVALEEGPRSPSSRASR